MCLVTVLTTYLWSETEVRFERYYRFVTTALVCQQNGITIVVPRIWFQDQDGFSSIIACSNFVIKRCFGWKPPDETGMCNASRVEVFHTIPSIIIIVVRRR